MSQTFTIEDARPADADAIAKLIRELALYERAPDEAVLTPEIILEDGFGPNKIFTCYVARLGADVVGIALLYTKYSTWKGRCVFLEDIIVTEKHRNKGIGKALFQRAIRYAAELKAGRLEWQVLDWNEPAIGFYKNFGAILDPTWINCKFTREQLEQLNAGF
jgi:GNAT superfamily N-acetyltransferase